MQPLPLIFARYSHRPLQPRWFVRLLFALLLTACAPIQPVSPADQTAAETPTEVAGADGSTIDGAFPVTIENCGLESTYTQAPTRAVTMNQAATEIMLKLGLEESMVGTASLDDAVLPELQAAYKSIPVLSDAYPSQEVLPKKR